MNHEQDDPMAARLTQLLVDAAQAVTVSEGSLQTVLRRANRPRPRRWAVPVLAAASVLVVAGVAALELRPPGGVAPVGPGPSSSLPAGTSTVGPGPSSSLPAGTSTPPSPAQGAARLPVYYAGVFDGQARLYREFHLVQTSQPAADAVRQSLAAAPFDPDYRSLFAAGTTLVSYTRSGSVAIVVLSGAPDQYPAVALQQIVYTVTAADPTVTAVRIRSGAVSTGPLTRGDPTLYVSPVWLLAPTGGATVSSPVTLSGTASVFEAVVGWEVDRTDGTRVAGGSASTPVAAPARGPWSVTLPLPPGHYVASAFEISAKDGRRVWVDTKSFTVG